eukprot:585472-Pleurochrysis_carterae.AAC.1
MGVVLGMVAAAVSTVALVSFGGQREAEEWLWRQPSSETGRQASGRVTATVRLNGVGSLGFREGWEVAPAAC